MSSKDNYTYMALCVCNSWRRGNYWDGSVTEYEWDLSQCFDSLICRNMPGECSWRETGAVAITRREASTEYDLCCPARQRFFSSLYKPTPHTEAEIMNVQSVEVSGHNLESSQTWGFCMDFLNHMEGGIVFFISFSFFLLYRNCKRMREVWRKRNLKQSCRGDCE